MIYVVFLLFCLLVIMLEYALSKGIRLGEIVTVLVFVLLFFVFEMHS